MRRTANSWIIHAIIALAAAAVLSGCGTPADDAETGSQSSVGKAMELKDAGAQVKYDKADIISKVRKTGNKVVLIGVDGATWDLLLPLVNSGELPNIKKLMYRGSWGNLKSGEGGVSPIIWTTIATGVSQEKHGIRSFVVKVPGEYDQVPVTSNFRTREALWTLLSEYGRKVGVINWWASWPAERVNGFIVSNNLFYLPWLESADFKARENATYPPELYGDIKRFLRVSPDELRQNLLKITDDVRPVKGYTSKGALSRGIDDKTFGLELMKYDLQKFVELETKSSRISPYLYKKYEPDFFGFYFEGTDVVSHHWWKYMEPVSLKNKYMYDLPEDDLAKYRDIIPSYYVWIDGLIGNFLDNVDKDTVVIIVSDHGFQGSPSDYGRIVDVNRLFNKLGWLYYSKDGSIDWSRTKISDFSQSEFWEAERRLFINVRGREPQGIVEPGEEYEKFRHEVVDTLKNLRITGKGWPLFDKILLAEDAKKIPGEQADVVAVLQYLPREYSVEHNGETIPLREFIYPRPISGNHQENGIVLIAGPEIKEMNILEGADIYDVFPTVLYTMGFPVPRDIDGEVITGAFEDDYLARFPIETVETYEKPGKTGDKEIKISTADKEMKETLKSLGYIQ